MREIDKKLIEAIENERPLEEIKKLIERPLHFLCKA